MKLQIALSPALLLLAQQSNAQFDDDWASGWASPCNTDLQSLPFCDQTLDLSERVADMLKRIPLSAKLGNNKVSC